MYGNDKRKPIGGISSCALYPADAARISAVTRQGCKVTFNKAPYEFELFDEHSSLSEQMVAENGILKVTHRLTLVADRNLASAWLEAPFTNQAIDKGLVAEVTLTDGRHLLVGWSHRFQAEQPLRLSSLRSDSGTRANETPTLTLTLESRDNTFAMPVIQES